MRYFSVPVSTFIAVALLFGGSVLAQPGTGTLRVATTGSNTAGCGSAGTPCAAIQQAVNQAVSGDTILVAAGTYTYNAALDTLCTANIGDTAVVCILNKELIILGGYGGGNWTTADPVANPTVIDGVNSRRGVLVLQTAMGQPTASLRLEGVTVTRGLAQGATSGGDLATFAFGGGLLSTASQIVLRDVTFSANRALGGNTSSAYGGAGSGGGAALRTAPAGTELTRVTFLNNEARGGTGPDRGGLALGGGLYTFQSTVTGTDLTFTGNSATAGNSAGSGVSGFKADAQGGAAAIQTGSNVQFTRVSASGNSARGGNAATEGGGAFGGALFAELATFSVTGGDLRDNTSRGGDAHNGGLGTGGGIMTTASDIVLEQVAMIANTATGGSGSGGSRGSAGGGGGYFERFSGATTVALRNSIVADNLAEFGATGSTVGGGGGGLFFIGTDATVSHTTLARNRLGAAPLQGLAMVLVTPGASTTVDLDYCIVADHTDYPTPVVAVHVQPGSTINISRGLYSGNVANDNSGGFGGSPGTFNGLGTMLSAPSVGFLSPGSPSFDYHLTAGSPAVDQATGSSETQDFDGDLRDASPDIGADELGGSSLIFGDGFESGNVSAWSTSSGLGS